jgi:hypothetical protein
MPPSGENVAQPARDNAAADIRINRDALRRTADIIKGVAG